MHASHILKIFSVNTKFSDVPCVVILIAEIVVVNHSLKLLSTGSGELFWKY